MRFTPITLAMMDACDGIEIPCVGMSQPVFSQARAPTRIRAQVQQRWQAPPPAQWSDTQLDAAAAWLHG